MNKTEKPVNRAVYYAKAICIFCVICAHCGSIREGSGLFITLSAKVLGRLGVLGVACFFILAGALFSADSKPFKVLWKNKLVRLGIPWLISATAVYLYVTLRRPPLRLSGWALYVLGYETYCYYLTVMFICFLLFSLPLMRRTVPCLVWVAVTLLSVSLWPDKGFLTPGLDPFNWIGYFAMGLLIRRYRYGFEKFLRCLLPWRFGVYGLFLVLQFFFGVSYWNGVKPLIALLCCLCWMLAATALADKNAFSFLQPIGKNSLFIYLWHMPIAGIVAKLFKNGPLQWLVLVRPFVVLGVMILAMYCLRLIRNKHLNRLVGYSA